MPPFEPAGIASRHAGQPAAHLRRHGRHSRSLGRRERPDIDDLDVVRMQLEHYAVVWHPFAGKSRDVQQVARDEWDVAQRIPRHPQVQTGAAEGCAHLVGQGHRIEHLQCAPHEHRSRATIDKEGRARVAARHQVLGCVTRGGHPDRSRRKAVGSRVDQRKARGPKGEHADLGSAQDRVGLAAQAHERNSRTRIVRWCRGCVPAHARADV